jgi:hypothetical protein
MSARRFNATDYRIESVASGAQEPEVMRARDLCGCMTKLSLLLSSGHRILAIYRGDERLNDVVYDAMVLLAGRRVMLQSIAAALDLSALEVEGLFGHLFLDGALIMQGLQGLGTDHN